ncbi:sensor histidine kinase [Hansschlegelia quercus]|uniref:Blue-light-activated histidine kinase n=1 Tax=Hansschlegelia quercus TaxID=2528245 RepID=A0A4Q9GPR0_9HYPH|nr:HWE histidine kinase domain-containing protein [Hansschlegelia quercus]TBN53910.1 PAS domain S-box protein [Hansschlegelia quercus]
MASRLGAFDWRGHPLGPPEEWPGELKAALGICMHSSLPTAIYWGPELRLLYNDAWSSVPRDRHPWAVGRPAKEVWADIWPVVGPQFEEVFGRGRGVSSDGQMLAIKRDGVPEETYWNYSLTPIFDASGGVAGVFNQGAEITESVLKSRDQSFLLAFGDRLRDMTEDGQAGALASAVEALAAHLRLDRVGYAAVEDGVATVVRSWSTPRLEDTTAKRFTLDEFGAEEMATLLRGEVISSANIASDPRYGEEERRRYASYSVGAQMVAPFVRAGRVLSFIFFNTIGPRRWTGRDAELARDVAERIWVASDRAEASIRLRASEQRFALLFGQASVGLSEVDRAGRFTRVNDSMGRLLDRSPESIVGMSVADVTHPEDVDDTGAEILRGAETGEPYTIEKRYLKPDGSSFWAVTNVTPVVDAAGLVSGFFAVTTDVGERKEQERIRSWLLAELNHRVRNNLVTVQSLAHHTKLTTSSSDEFERVFNARLMALSRAHDVLMRETWASAALSDLLAGTLAPYEIEGLSRVTLGGPEIRLSPTAAVTLNLAFHELATNAAKFGALSRPEGRVVVTWSVDAARGDGAVELNWRECGGPPVSAPRRRGFGLRLIERGAPRELGGHAIMDFATNGLACAFQLPLSEKIMTP